MYKKASKLKLRFVTVKGSISVEQLWTLKQSDLSDAIKAVKKILKKNDDDELSFLENVVVADDINQLRFDILKDIYITNKEEAKEKRNAADNKAHNQRIDELIAEKEEEGLKGKSIDELKSLRK